MVWRVGQRGGCELAGGLLEAALRSGEEGAASVALGLAGALAGDARNRRKMEEMGLGVMLEQAVELGCAVPMALTSVFREGE